MVNTKNLVLVFKTEDDEDYKITISDVKDNLMQEDVVQVMETIIDNNCLLTNDGKQFESIGNCYYRTVTEVPLETADGE